MESQTSVRLSFMCFKFLMNRFAVADRFIRIIVRHRHPSKPSPHSLECRNRLQNTFKRTKKRSRLENSITVSRYRCLPLFSDPLFDVAAFLPGTRSMELSNCKIVIAVSTSVRLWFFPHSSLISTQEKREKNGKTKYFCSQTFAQKILLHFIFHKMERSTN